jgi:opine dehydrogenase
MIAVPSIKTIAIIGAGNGGCAAAAHLAHRGFDIHLYGRSRATTEPLSAIGGIEYEGALGEGFASLSLITNDAGAAIAGADLVLIMAPTHAHEDVARAIAPHIAPEQLVMAAPGHTLLLIPDAIRKAGGQLGLYCDSSSLPFICRKSAPARINITRARKSCILPRSRARKSPRRPTSYGGFSRTSSRPRHCCIRFSLTPTLSIIRLRCCSMSATWRRPTATITTITTASRRVSVA